MTLPQLQLVKINIVTDINLNKLEYKYADNIALNIIALPKDNCIIKLIKIRFLPFLLINNKSNYNGIVILR